MNRSVLQDAGGRKNGTEPHGPTDRTSTTKAMALHQTQTTWSISQDGTSLMQQAQPVCTINSQDTSYLITSSPTNKEMQRFFLKQEAATMSSGKQHNEHTPVMTVL